MNSRKKAHFSLLLFSLSGTLTGCLFGENKTYFDYRNTSGTAKSAVSHDQQPDSNDQGNLEPEGTTPYCCNLITGNLVPASQTGCDRGLALIPSSSNEECQISFHETPANFETLTEQFPLTVNAKKKIDFLFVVDNSGSMEDNQSKLADGFENFAESFFGRDDLDLCISIITSDRYLGRSSSHHYMRERSVPCTSNGFFPEIIHSFKTNVKVGTRGSATEQIGKSLVTYLYDLEKWGDTIDLNRHTGFFRSDAVANITILTDENNWFFRNPEMPEYRNDIPVTQNASVYNSPVMAVDSRKGIKDYLDEFFQTIQPSHAPTYSVSTFLQTDGTSTSFPGLSMNLFQLSEMVGRESAMTNINGNISNFTNLYQGISENLVKRASAFHMGHSIEEIQFVKIKSADQSERTLVPNVDYTVQNPDGVILNDSTSATISEGDVLIVQYQYRSNQ